MEVYVKVMEEGLDMGMGMYRDSSIDRLLEQLCIELAD